MKRLSLSLLMATFLISCQEEASHNDPTANYIKKNSGNNGGISDNNSDQNDPNNPTDAPIDAGLGVLLFAGAAYGVKKIRNRKQKN